MDVLDRVLVGITVSVFGILFTHLIDSFIRFLKKISARKTKRQKRYRSCITGRFISRDEAKRQPKTSKIEILYFN